MPEGDFKSFEYNELDKLYRRYMPSTAVIEIMGFLCMLDAAGVTTGERLRQLIESHNRRIAQLKRVPDLSKRKLTLDRLDSGMFSDGARDDAVSNFNDHGRVAFNIRTICRLLVEVASRAIITEAMGLLVKLGFFQKVPGGAFGANVYVSDGRLEAIYRSYLTSVQTICSKKQSVGAGPTRPGNPPEATGAAAALGTNTARKDEDND